MTEWQELPLAELCDSVQYGVTTSARPVGFDGPRLLRITDIVPPRIDWSAVPPCDLSERDAARFALEEGDIVVARTGATVGYAKYVSAPPVPAVFASYLVRFRVGPNVDARFVGQVVQSSAYKQFVAANAGGAAQPNANAKTLGAFPVWLPHLATQRRIAAVLGAFDELIETNERRIELLEELARSLYREWFVRFRFPGHDSLALVESSIGSMPDGWNIRTLADIAEVRVDGVVPADLKCDEPYVGLEHLPRRSTTLRHWGSVEPVSSRKLRFSQGDTLFGKIRPYFHKVVWAPFAGVASSDTIVLRPRTDPALSALVNAVASSDGLVAGLRKR